MKRLAPWMAAVGLGWALYRLGEHFWEPAVFAAALAAAFWPCARMLRVGMGRRLSSLAMAGLLSLGLAAPACWAWSSSFGELDKIVQSLGAEPAVGAGLDWQGKAKQWGVAAATQARRSPAWSERAAKAGAIPWGSIGLTAILLYFMLADGQAAMSWAQARAEQWGAGQGGAAWGSAATAFSCTAKGCLWFGLLSFAALWGLFYAAGAPSPLAFAVAGACASMLPFVAPIMVGCVAAALLAPGNVAGPLALLVIGGGGLGVANNILRPKWVGDASGLPMPAALMGMAGGALAWGPAGLLAGPAMVAAALALAEGRGGVKEGA